MSGKGTRIDGPIVLELEAEPTIETGGQLAMVEIQEIIYLMIVASPSFS